MHTENDPETTPVARTILMLLGSYAFGFNLHNIIHELGHAVAIWLQGGSVPGFYLHPFDSCLTYGTYVPNHILLYAGGAFIGGASTLLFPVLAWKIRRPLVLPFVMACSAGLVTTARWMLVTPFFKTVDYSGMIALGVPAACITLSGLLYLIIGMIVLVLFLPMFGVGYDANLAKRLLILQLGMLPYSLVSAVYASVTKGVAPHWLIAGLMISAGVISVEAMLSRWLPLRTARFRKIPVMRVRLSHVVIVWTAAILLIIGMRLASTPQV